MAEVVAQSSASSGTAVSAVAGNGSIKFSGHSSQHQLPVLDSQRLQIHQARHAQSQYKPAVSPVNSNDSNSTFFSSSNSRQMSGSEQSSVPRGLPPIVSTMSNSPPAGYAMSDSLQADQQSLDGDSSAPRKRSKVSRACDECRRKKIRCDATSESGIEQCSSCKRVGSKCSFSRVPMKRGPSKGYIKELADRLNTLENSISVGDLHGYPNAIDEESPGPSAADSTSPPPMSVSSSSKQPRKRTLSSTSDYQTSVHLLQPLPYPNSTPRAGERLPPIDSFHPATQQQHQQRSQQLHQQRQLPHPHPPGHRPPPPHQGPLHRDPYQPRPSLDVAPVGYTSAASPDGSGSYWPGYRDAGTSRDRRRTSVSYPFETPEQRRPPLNSAPCEMNLFDWDEDAIEQYYNVIHPTFPLLPHSKARLRQRLENASPHIRDALLEALYAAVRSNPSAPISGPSNPKRAAELTITSQFDHPSFASSFSMNLLHLQTSILMTLEADNHGPATMRGQHGPPRAARLGSAIGMAYSLKLHHNQTREQYSTGDPDSDEKLGRRAWCVLVILDRWHAISTSSPLFIPDSSVVLGAEDQSILGVVPFHVARLSCILGNLAEAFTSANESVSSTSVNPFISKLLRGQLERFRESLDGVLGSLNLLHIAFYHCLLLILRHNSATEPRALMEPANRMAAMLDNSLTPITPLNHHFAALSLTTLVDIAEIPGYEEEAWKGILQLKEALQKRRGLATRADSTGWDSAIRDLIEKKERRRMEKIRERAEQRESMSAGNSSLQHLADLAIQADGADQRKDRIGLDQRKLITYGYLGSILL